MPHRAGRVQDIPEQGVVVVEVDGVEVGIMKLLGQLHAFENRCPHQGGPVCDGLLIGQQEGVLDASQRVVGERLSTERFNLVCPWHGWSYDPVTGANIGDARVRLRRWGVEVRGEEVFLTPPRGA
jgi:nitrite reductase (NADH) small subunit